MLRMPRLRLLDYRPSWITSVVLLGAFLLQGAMSPLSAQGAANYIVLFQDGTPPAARARAVGNAGAAVHVTFRGVAAASVTVPSARALAALQNDPSVLSVVPNRPVTAWQGATGKSGKGGGKPGGGSNAS